MSRRKILARTAAVYGDGFKDQSTTLVAGIIWREPLRFTGMVSKFGGVGVTGQGLGANRCGLRGWFQRTCR